MGAVSRRSFLAAGAAGAAAVVLPSSSGAAAAVTDDGSAAAVDGVVIHVRDARRGEVSIMGADSEVVVRDRALVRAVAKAASSGKRG